MNFPVFADEKVRYIYLHVLVLVHLLANFDPSFAIFAGHYDAQGEWSVGQWGKEVVLLLLGNAAHLVIVKLDRYALELIGFVAHHGVAYV